MPKRATIIDVAKLAGVSTMTVSRVMSNSEKVRESTRQKVKKAIAALNYQPEFSARALSKKITGNLGFLVQHGHRNREFYYHVANGVEAELNKHNYSLINHFHPFDAKHLPAMITQRKVDGVIVGGVKVDDIVINALMDWNLPVVVIDNLLKLESVHYVLSDYRKGADEAVHYLNVLGHKEIAFLGMDRKFYCTVSKLAGYTNALKKIGIKVKKENIFYENSPDFMAQNLIRRIMKSENKITAVLCASDSTACRLLKLFRKSGIKVPGDVSVIGFNDISLAELSVPALTTVRVEKELLGTVAAQKLLQSIWNPKITSSKTIVNTKLIIRDSCQKYRKRADASEKKQFISGGDVAAMNT